MKIQLEMTRQHKTFIYQHDNAITNILLEQENVFKATDEAELLVSIRQCASSKDKSLAKDIFHRI
jgi:hypothetical protein